MEIQHDDDLLPEDLEFLASVEEKVTRFLATYKPLQSQSTFRWQVNREDSAEPVFELLTWGQTARPVLSGTRSELQNIQISPARHTSSTHRPPDR